MIRDIFECIRKGMVAVLNTYVSVVNWLVGSQVFDRIDDEIYNINNNTEFYVRYRKSKWRKEDWEIKIVKGVRELEKTVRKLLKEDLYTSIWIDDSNEDEFEDDWFYRNFYKTYSNRKLIKKFDREFSKEYAKTHKGVAGAMPDVEEVYKRYYELKK